jgi:quercetin dioxygenase-like cupin family protein
MSSLHPVGDVVLWENDIVRVWQIDVPPDGELRLHQHQNPYVVVHETDGDITVSEAGKPPVERSVRALEADWHPVGELHALRNRGAERYRNVLVEIKSGERGGGDGHRH